MGNLRDSGWLRGAGVKFGTIIADPPWEYSRTSGDLKLRGYSDMHYEPLTTDRLKKLPVTDISSDHCLLFLWTTSPFLADGSALEVTRAWGFEPVTLLYWHKLTEFKTSHLGGVGYWYRGNCEPVMVAKRKGTPSFRWAGMSNWTKWDKSALFEAQKGKHSDKPDVLHERIERANVYLKKNKDDSFTEIAGYPQPYLEMFGRRARSGWTVIGDEAPGCLGEDIEASLARLALLPEQIAFPEAV